MSAVSEPPLHHLDRLTDSTGLIQHAIYGLRRLDSGYTIDDNARALRLCAQLWSHRPKQRMLDRIGVYLSLLDYARRPGGGFHNLMSFQRQWLDTDSSGDCQGQAVRALAEVLGSCLPSDYRALARELIDAVMPTLAELKSLRAQAYVVLAYGRLRDAHILKIDALAEVARRAADNLVDCFNRSQRDGWRWFESRMTYANAVMPHAMLVAAQCWPETTFLQVAQDSFAFLDRETTVDGVFWPVGNGGWYSRGEVKATYDQQPVEAGAMADAALAAFQLRSDARYLASFSRARMWFHGENSLRQSLVDLHSGGCCDGLQIGGLNRNQGAESTLAYLTTEVLNFRLQSSESPSPADLGATAAGARVASNE